MRVEEHTPIEQRLRGRVPQAFGPQSTVSRAPASLGTRRRWWFNLLCLTWALTGPGCVGEPKPPSGSTSIVAIVANRSVPASLRIANQYARSRDLRQSHVLRLRMPREEHISRQTFEDRILQPLMEWWNGLPSEQQPHYLVLARGVPLGIQGSGGLNGTRASVDSELTLLPRWAAGDSLLLEGRSRNPYFAPLHEPGQPESPLAERMVLVTRLTGFTEATATDLIDRADRANRAEGRVSAATVLLDQRAGRSDLGEQSLRRAAQRVTVLGATAVFDSTRTFLARSTVPLIGYASWGSNDSNYRREVSFRWQDGAIATSFVSSSARTFTQPPDDWHPGPSRKREHEFGGSTQSLIADLIESGATGAIGNVYEPYLDACARPDMLFTAYLSGHNLAEAAYLSIPFLSWQTVVIGDPLCAPFTRPDSQQSGSD